MKKSLLPLLILLGSTFPAMAHPPIFHGLGGTEAAQAGFFHPFTGIDHLVVMVAVGLWAVQMGGRALWVLPASFVGSMILGGLVGLSGFHAPVAESGILASIILLGAALGMAWNPPLIIAALFVGAGGLCHGYAHGAEMSAGLIPAIYFAGMIVATSLLHALGVGTGLFLRRNQFMIMTRFAGLMILAFAVYDFIWPVA
jgi:urease accessory protein